MSLILYALLPALLLLLFGGLLAAWIQLAYRPDSKLEQAASRAGLWALALYAVWMLLITIVQRQIPIVTLGQLTAFLGLLIWADQAYVHHKTNQRMLVLLPVGTVVALLLVAIVAGVRPESAPAVMRGPWVAFHVTLSLAGVAMLMGGGVYGIGYVILHRQIKRHTFGQLFARLPSLDDMHRLRNIAVYVSWLLITVSLLTATVWMLLMKSAAGIIHSHLHPMVMLWIGVTLLALLARMRRLSHVRLAKMTVILVLHVLGLLLLSVLGIFSGV